MMPELQRFGASRSPVVVIDRFSGRLSEAIDAAAELAPFEASERTYYPGLRRFITEADGRAFAYVEKTLQDAAPFIGGVFNLDGFELREASFSLVTSRPETLNSAQRAPHFDSSDPKQIAILHYLCDLPNTGTGFYRQRETGIEVVDADNTESFIASARRSAEDRTEQAGYISGSNKHYDLIGATDARPDRLIIYQGCLLHSGIIPPDMSFSDDPRFGRLTANIFVQGL
jgi:hypothetical protein